MFAPVNLSLANDRVIWLLFAIVILTIGGWVATAVQNSRRAHKLVKMLNNCGRGRLVLERQVSPRGFSGRIVPAPEPFTQFTVIYQNGALHSLGWLVRLLLWHKERLLIQADLPGEPGTELIWQHEQIPVRALTYRENPGLWVQRRLDFLTIEYATRGANPSAMIHVFSTLQTRFAPFLEHLLIQADNAPVVEILLQMAGLEDEEIPALVTLIRAVGRAALQR